MILVGDTHGLGTFGMLIAKKEITNQNLVHVGDFGLGFSGIGTDIMNLMNLDELLVESNNVLYVIRGNHDNPIFWDKSKGLNLPKFHNIKLVDDYSIIPIEGRNTLFIGGGISIDRSVRMIEKPYPTWWEDEKFKFNYGRLEKALKGQTVIDLVVTHIAPKTVYPFTENVRIVNQWHEIEKQHGRNLKAELDVEREDLYKVYNALANVNLLPENWFYGHYHSSKETVKGVTRFRLLDINELYELV